MKILIFALMLGFAGGLAQTGLTRCFASETPPFSGNLPLPGTASFFKTTEAPHRNPSPLLTRPGVLLSPPLSQPRSFSQTLNSSFYDLTLRHEINPSFTPSLFQNLDPVEQVDKGTQLVSMVGINWSPQEGWSLGTYFQIEYDDSELIHQFLDWFSLRASYPLWENQLILSLYFYKGITNSDTWLQPELTYQFTDEISFSLRADLVYGSDDPDQGYVGMFEDQSRIFAWVEAQF